MKQDIVKCAHKGGILTVLQDLKLLENRAKVGKNTQNLFLLCDTFMFK